MAKKEIVHTKHRIKVYHLGKFIYSFVCNGEECNAKTKSTA